MYILQFADLHIAEDAIKSVLKDKMGKLAEALSRIVPEDNCIICCLLGDVVDKGFAGGYKIALEILKYLMSQLEKERITVLFKVVPGNHDLIGDNLSEFNQFASTLMKKTILFSKDKSILYENEDGYQFILVNSTIDGRDYGKIDFSLLNQDMSNKRNFLLVHHALVSGDEEDNAAIRNGYALQQYLEKHNIIAMFHGHTHGYKKMVLGDDCQIIGVGPMFKEVEDISNQCNLVKVTGNLIRKIVTLTYQGDREIWDENETYENTFDNVYSSNQLYLLYEKILDDVTSNDYLLNVKFSLNMYMDEFENEIRKNFSQYKDEAVEWQMDDCPEKLMHNHGSLMKWKDKNWEDFIVELLQRNASNKRAIIPLIDKEWAFKGGDGDFPSLDIIQFGFSDESKNDLLVTVYYRALEVKEFLPLNLYELYLMIKRIKKRILSINKVSICLFAFRAEVKKEISRFRKAKIEMLKEAELAVMVAAGKLDDLGELIEEKAAMGDTVIEREWLEKLRNSLEAGYDKSNKKEVLEQLDKVVVALDELQSGRLCCSRYSRTQKMEDEANVAMKKLACLIKK